MLGFENWKTPCKVKRENLVSLPLNSAASSSETQGQIKGARESLNGRENMARRKVKNSEKSPWGQCLTRPVPNGRRRSVFWLVPENLCFSGTNQKPERWRPFGTGLVRHCPQGLFSPFFTFLIGQKNTKLFWHQSEVRTAATVWNWSGKTLSSGALLAVLYFSSCHIFPPV